MPSTEIVSATRKWITAQRQLTIVTAIAVALPTAYAFQSWSGAAGSGFLLLLTLAVGVPTAYDEYWPTYDRTWKAVSWVLVSCAAATVEFAGFFLAGTTVLALTPITSAVVAFLVTNLGTVALLAVRRRGAP